MISSVEHLSMCLLAKDMSLLGKVSLQVCCLFVLIEVFFFNIKLDEMFIYLDINSYQPFYLPIFSPLHRLSFHFANAFLCCAKGFKFN